MSKYSDSVWVREMDMKMVVRLLCGNDNYYEKKQYTMLSGMWVKGNPLTCYLWNSKLIQMLWKSVRQSFKTKRRSIVGTSYVAPGYLPEGIHDNIS